jgi:tetratricopeptide (TPR) repeat protein
VAIQLLVRGLVVLACVAGVVVSVISRDSRVKAEEVFRVYNQDRDAKAALKLLDESRRLNPNFELDIAQAQLDRARAEQILVPALREEPDIAETWLALANERREAGDLPGARRAYARARELAPRFVSPDGP